MCAPWHPARLDPLDSTHHSLTSLHRVHAGCLAPPSPRAYPAPSELSTITSTFVRRSRVRPTATRPDMDIHQACGHHTSQTHTRHSRHIETRQTSYTWPPGRHRGLAALRTPESDPLQLDHLYRSGLVGHTHEPPTNSGAHLEPCSHSSSRPTPVPCLAPVLAWLAQCKELGSRSGSQLAVGLATATPSRALAHAWKEAHPRSAGLFSPVGLHSSYLVG